MSVSVVIADCVVFHISKDKKKYKKVIIFDLLDTIKEMPSAL